MTRILLSGCGGAMGKTIVATAQNNQLYTIVAGFDKMSKETADFPIFTSFADVNVEYDAIIDFSHPANLAELLDHVKSTKKPVVIATTGFTQTQINEIHNTATEAPVFFSANMSLGVSLLKELAITAAKVLGDPYDIEIIEKHHNQKLDAPSGTAILLADAIANSLPYETPYVYDRQCKREKRTNHEIGLHSVRGGTIVGEHDVIFAGQDEVVTLTHTAYSKAIFAKGSLTAAQFIAKCTAGLYDMSHLVQSV